MAESSNPDQVSTLLSQVRAGNTALAADAQALDQAAETATEIAGNIHSAHGAGGVPAEGVPGGAVPGDAVLPEAAFEAPPVRRGGGAAGGGSHAPEVRRLLAIEVPVIVQLGVRRMNVGEVMRFAVGAIIEFSKSAEEELELLANNKAIGKGHAVKVGENFGIKLTAIGPVKETIRKLGGA